MHKCAGASLLSVSVMIAAGCGGGAAQHKTTTVADESDDSGQTARPGSPDGTGPGAAAGAAAGDATAHAAGGLTYPVAHKGTVVDEYFGTKVADPYRWLEDTDSAETRSWIEAENKLTFGFLDKIAPREDLRKRLTALWNYEKQSAPARHAHRYFFYKNDGLQNQSVLLWTSKLGGKAHTLLDPNALAADGTVALGGTAVSDDGTHLAYGLESAGSDWAVWHVRDVASGKDLPDTLKWIKFSGASWTHNGRGFYYARFPEPKEGQALTSKNENQKLYYHRLHTDQSKDTLIYERPDQPSWSFGPTVTEDGRYLVVSVWKGTGPKNLVMVQDLRHGAGKKGALKTLVGEFEAKYDFIGNDGPVLWFVTDKDAPLGRIIAIDLRKPDPAHWRELVPQSTDTLQGASTVGGQMFANYLHDAHTRVAVFNPRTGAHLRDVELPGIGSAGGFYGKKNFTETFYSFTSFTVPGAVYRYDIKSGKSTPYWTPTVDFDASQYETEQVFYNSKDGTRVPMFITHKKGIALDGSHPTILYGYGGFDISLTPYFSVTYAVWLEKGGILAIPNLRGGGEYGEKWHMAGTKLHKQNVFDDMIAAGEWLIAHKYTSKKKLAIQGGSNGGLLVGACVTERPDLWGAALPAVGVMDMLRYQKFTIGWAWADDYGTSADSPEQFKALYAYSPLHNIKPGTSYPPTLITTADHDDRVVPGHSFKFAATLQAAQAGPAPVLIRIQTRAGHGGGKPTSMRIAESTDELAFLMKVFEME